MTGPLRRTKRIRRVAGLVLLASAGYAAPGMAEVPGDPPPTQARIWLYRQFSPAEPMNSAQVMVDDKIIGNSVPGRRFHLDVAPGTHHLSVESFGKDVNQDRNVSLAAGDEFYVKIASLRGWSSQFSYSRDTFYIWPVPPAVARAEIAQTTD